MPTIGAGDGISRFQDGGNTCAARLLADAQMGRAANQVFQKQPLNAFLRRPDFHHLFEYVLTLFQRQRCHLSVL
jgi:hypothetical protein